MHLVQEASGVCSSGAIFTPKKKKSGLAECPPEHVNQKDR